MQPLPRRNRRGAPCYQCLQEAPLRARSKTQTENAPRDYTRRVPVLRFTTRKLAVSLKARYVNDVHLPRFGGAAGVRALPLNANPTCHLIRNSHPQARCLTGIQRISPPRTLGMIAKRRFCVNCRARPNWRVERFQPRDGRKMAKAIGSAGAT